MLDLNASRTRIKTASDSQAFRRRGAVTWRDVLAALQLDETRSHAIDLYRAAGFTPDAFRMRPARLAMADALSRTEDALEGRQGARKAEAARIREVRRALEDEAEGV